MKYKILPVILAGGCGKRLWPLSLEEKPKQFLPLFDNHSLMQNTITRLEGLENLLPPLIISNESYKGLINEQLAELSIKDTHIILEPIGRNTAPAITLAALYAKQRHQNPVLLVLPSDHFIANKKLFQQAIENALPHAKNDRLITFGIKPNKPETNYGYIEAGLALDSNAFQIAKFTEKPNMESAKRYFTLENYYWNSGIFIFQTTAYLDEAAQLAPQILKTCLKIFESAAAIDSYYSFKKSSFEQCPSISIDYAIMEKTNNAIVLPVDLAWSDLGSWAALWEISSKDKNGNVLKGKQIIANNTRNCYIQSDAKLVVQDLDNMAVINTKKGHIIKPLES